MICYTDIKSGVGHLGGGPKRCQPRAVDGQKRVRRRESGPLVAVDKGMVLGQALPERGRFLHQIGVVASLWAIERRLQQSRIAHPRLPAIALDLIGMHGQDFGEREVIAHFASFW